MTNTDDWTRFVKMMDKAGWESQGEVLLGSFRHSKTGLVYYPNGEVFGSNTNIGDWRVWLEAGQTPAPF